MWDNTALVFRRLRRAKAPRTRARSADSPPWYSLEAPYTVDGATHTAAHGSVFGTFSTVSTPESDPEFHPNDAWFCWCGLMFPACGAARIELLLPDARSIRPLACQIARCLLAQFHPCSRTRQVTRLIERSVSNVDACAARRPTSSPRRSGVNLGNKKKLPGFYLVGDASR